MDSRSLSEELVAVYTSRAIAYGEASRKHSPRQTNRCYDQVILALKALDMAGVRTALLVLLEHPDAWVRCAAATHLLPYREEQAKLTLKKIVEENAGGVSFDAKMVLQEWEKGTLKVP